MNIEKLIERLRTESLYKDKATLEIMDLCIEAADALSTLWDENERLRDEVERQRRSADNAYSNFKHNYKDHWGIERGTGRGWPGIVTHWMPLPDQPKEG